MRRFHSIICTKNNLIEDLIDCSFLFDNCAQSRCSRRKKEEKKMFTFHFRWWPSSIVHNWQLRCTSFASLHARTTANAINYSFILLLASIIRTLLFGRRQFASSRILRIKHFRWCTRPMQMQQCGARCPWTNQSHTTIDSNAFFRFSFHPLFIYRFKHIIRHARMWSACGASIDYFITIIMNYCAVATVAMWKCK